MRLCAAISLGGDRGLLVAHRNGIAAIVDVASKTVVETVTLAHATQVVAVNPLHNTVYVGPPAQQG
jgi:hypothetical protein